jgi:hypothetical protein
MLARIGRITPASGGVNALRADYLGNLIISGGDYKDAMLAGRLYVAYQASVAVALFTATAAIGIQIYNPTASGINVVIHKWAAIVWATSASMTGMVLAIANASLGAPATPVVPTYAGKALLTSTIPVTGIAVATTTCTLAAAPVVAWPLFHNTAAINTVGAEMMGDDLRGGVGFAPGTVAVIGALGAAGVTVNMAVLYEEVPINT